MVAAAVVLAVLLTVAYAAGYTTGRYGARAERHQRDRWNYWPQTKARRR